jgi:hypothetical protein
MLCNKCGHDHIEHLNTGHTYAHAEYCKVKGCSCKQFVPPGDAEVYGLSEEARKMMTGLREATKNLYAPDPINPSHYDGDACMKAIEEATKHDIGPVGFLRGQLIKYVWRLGRKDQVDTEAGKIKWYLDRLIGLLK